MTVFSLYKGLCPLTLKVSLLKDWWTIWKMLFRGLDVTWNIKWALMWNIKWTIQRNMKLNISRKQKWKHIEQWCTLVTLPLMQHIIINANVKVEALTQYGNSLFNIFIHIWGTVSGYSRTFSLAVVWRKYFGRWRISRWVQYITRSSVDKRGIVWIFPTKGSITNCKYGLMVQHFWASRVHKLSIDLGLTNVCAQANQAGLEIKN